MSSGSRNSKDKYLQEKVDTFVLRVPKGEKEKIKSHAAAVGKSLNSYILDLIKRDMPAFERNISKPSESKPRRNSLPDFLD